MDKRKEHYVTVILSTLSMIFLIYIGSTLFKRTKVDLTQEQLYSLSEGTVKILRKLNRPLKIKLYYSKTAANKGTEGIRAFNNYYLYIRDLLREYVSHSRNNLSLEVIDPRPDTREEEDALAYGLKKFHLTETEKYFFGLVVTTESGAEKVIEFFDPADRDNVEYEITKLIYSATDPVKKKVGILSSLPVLNEEISPYMAQIMRMQGKDPQQSWLFTELLRDFYEVKKIDTDVSKISGVDVLMIIHPKDLSEKTQFAIDQFLMRGGKVLVLVDPHSFEEQTTATGPVGAELASSNLPNLFKKWGIQYSPEQFVGDKYLSGVGRVSASSAPGRILPLVQCDQRCVKEHQDAITSGLNTTVFLFPGKVTFKETEGLTATTIISTTNKGNTYTAQRWMLNNPEAMWQMFREGDAAVPFGVKLVGKFKTAFSNGIEMEEEVEGKKGKTKKKKLEALKESTKETAVVVIGDVDFIADRFSFRQSMFGTAMANDNPTLALNAIESLAGSTDLMNVRSKGRINRSFKVIDAIEFESERKTMNKVSQINGEIANYQKELAALGRQANEQNLALLQNESLNKRKELVRKIAELKRELRDVKREGREDIEWIGKMLQYLNTLFMPFILLLIGLIVYYQRRKLQLS